MKLCLCCCFQTERRACMLAEIMLMLSPPRHTSHFLCQSWYQTRVQLCVVVQSLLRHVPTCCRALCRRTRNLPAGCLLRCWQSLNSALLICASYQRQTDLTSFDWSDRDRNTEWELMWRRDEGSVSGRKRWRERMVLKQDVSPYLNFKKDSSSRDDGYFSGEGRCWVTAALREIFLLSLLCQRNES